MLVALVSHVSMREMFSACVPRLMVEIKNVVEGGKSMKHYLMKIGAKRKKILQSNIVSFKKGFFCTLYLPVTKNMSVRIAAKDNGSLQGRVCLTSERRGEVVASDLNKTQDMVLSFYFHENPHK